MESPNAGPHRLLTIPVHANGVPHEIRVLEALRELIMMMPKREVDRLLTYLQSVNNGRTDGK